MQVQTTLPERMRTFATHPDLPRSPAPTGPIVVAAGGTATTDAVLGVARALAALTGAGVAVVPGRDDAAAPDDSDRPVRTDESIATAALARGAQVILVGRGQRGSSERASADERVMRLVRSVDVPVYAVDDAATGLAQRVVVAMDFSVHSVRAAQAALRLVDPNAVIALVHVWSRIGTIPGLGRTYEHALPAMFDSVRVRLAAPPTIRLEPVALVSGNPGAAVCDYAEASGADLVVSSTHGHGVVTRLSLGSVAAQLLRDTPCSYLCVPGRHATRPPRAPVFPDDSKPFFSTGG